MLRCAAPAVLCVLMLAATSNAQPATTDGPAGQVGASIPADTLRDLPVADSVYALLETTQSELIADRFNSGGLNVGGDTRVGGFLGSWSQTRFRIGDIDISDPMGGGAALLFPVASFWQHVTTTTGLFPADVNTPGLAVGLDPLRGGKAWSSIFTGTVSGGPLAADAPTKQPIPVARLKNFGQGSGIVTGPVSSRATLAVGASWMQGSSYRREQLATTDSALASAFAHLAVETSPDREWRVLGLVQRSLLPFEYWQLSRAPGAQATNTAVHVQTTLESHAADGARWRVFAGVTQRNRDNSIGSSTLYIDRIVDGPVQSVVESVADVTARRLSAGARIAPNTARDAALRMDYGVDLDLSSSTSSSVFAGTVREAVNSFPARIWSYNSIPGSPSRSTSTAAGFAHAVVTMSPRATLDAGARAEWVHGSADGAKTSVSWLSLLPRASLRLALGEQRALTFGYGRSANTLTHNWLAYGDPAAATARVVSVATPNTVVARVGPGINGNPAFSGLATDLKRPYTDELIVGWERRRGASTRYTLTGIARWENNMLGVVNTGVPTSGYSVISVPDAGKDLVDPADDRQLAIYNRLPSTFGQDAYLVTNPSQKRARAFALRMALEHNGDRLFMLLGATASAAQGAGGNRGYGPLENDQDQPGELFSTPNGGSYAYGRLFSDRAFTIKWTTLYRFPGDVTVAGIARYQDGQPFSRMVIAPSLNQGIEAVQAYPNGGSRYTFTGTFDVRAQKGFRAGTARVDAILDAYNLFTRNNEVEEYVVSGLQFRTPTAIQPPRSVHVGLRLTF